MGCAQSASYGWHAVALLQASLRKGRAQCARLCHDTSSALQEAEVEDADPAAGMYAKYDACLHGPRAELTHPPLSVAFLKKFLTIIKRRARSDNLPSTPLTLFFPHDLYLVLPDSLRPF